MEYLIYPVVFPLRTINPSWPSVFGSKHPPLSHHLQVNVQRIIYALVKYLTAFSQLVLVFSRQLVFSDSSPSDCVVSVL